MSGRRVSEEDEAGGTLTRLERIKRVPLPTPQSQASSSPLFEQEGSAICDQFYELISERRVSPCQDSTTVTIPLFKVKSNVCFKVYFMKVEISRIKFKYTGGECC
jgi:hypothetical protein